MWIVCLADNSHEMSSFIFSEKQQQQQNNLECINVSMVLLELNPFWSNVLLLFTKELMWRKLLSVKRWKCLTPKFDFNAETQNFIGYFYPST